MTYFDFIKNLFQNFFKNFLWYFGIASFFCIFIPFCDFIQNNDKLFCCICLSIIILIIYFIVILFFTPIKLINKINELEKENIELKNKQLPKIKTIDTTKAINRVILEPSELFDYDSLISFVFETDSGVEEIIAIGKVKQFTDRGYIIVEIQDKWTEKSKNYVDFIKNDRRILEKTFIKPYITCEFVEKILNDAEQASQATIISKYDEIFKKIMNKENING